MNAFDAAAWVAEYESIGGHVAVGRVSEARPGEVWISLTLPRDPARRGIRMLAALRAADADEDREGMVIEHVIGLRGLIFREDGTA